MARLLYIEASPRKERSASIQVARAFISQYRTTHPEAQVDTIDLWDQALPEFDGPVVAAKNAILHGLQPTDEQQQAWRQVEEIIARFTRADSYLLSLPMWNFSIPYKLKHYIDLIVQPGYTFSFSPGEGYKGLVTGKPVAVIYARGGNYSPGTGMEEFDLQKRYLETILGFIGCTDIRSIVTEPTLAPPAEKKRTLAAAIDQAREVAVTF